MMFPVSAEIESANPAGFSIVLSKEIVKVLEEGGESSNVRRGKVEIFSRFAPYKHTGTNKWSKYT